MKTYLVSLGICIALGTSMGAAYAGFDGHYAPENRSFYDGGLSSAGRVDTSGAPDSIVFHVDDGEFIGDYYCINTSLDTCGLSFTYNAPGGDPAGEFMWYTKNDFMPANTSNIAINPGDQFCFGGLGGGNARDVTISNFQTKACSAAVTAAREASFGGGGSSSSSASTADITSELREISLIDLAITKVVSTGTALSGTPVIWTLSYANNSTIAVSDVMIYDMLPSPALVTFTASTPLYNTFTNNTLSWKIPLLQPGQTGEIIVKGTVQGPVGALITNTGGIYYTMGGTAGEDNTPVNNVSSASITIIDPTKKPVVSKESMKVATPEHNAAPDIARRLGGPASYPEDSSYIVLPGISKTAPVVTASEQPNTFATVYKSLHSVTRGDNLELYNKTANNTYEKSEYKVITSYNLGEDIRANLPSKKGNVITLVATRSVGGIEQNWLVKAKLKKSKPSFTTATYKAKTTIGSSTTVGSSTKTKNGNSMVKTNSLNISKMSPGALTDIQLMPAVQDRVDQVMAAYHTYTPQVKAYLSQQLEDKVLPEAQKSKSYLTNAIQYIMQKLHSK